PSFGHESFAVTGPLALLGTASYPVSVRRPVGSFPASFGPGLTTGFLSLAVPLGPCDQVPGGLSPPGQRPCWAYQTTASVTLVTDAGQWAAYDRSAIERLHLTPGGIAYRHGLAVRTCALPGDDV